MPAKPTNPPVSEACASESRQPSRRDPYPRPILLFDADCNFCRFCVRWLVDRDPRGTLRYAALDSPPARRLLSEHGLPPDYYDSVVFFDDDDSVHFKSEAVLRAIRRIDCRWRLASALRIFPRFLRDPVYTLISKNRPAISRALGTIHRRWEPPPQVRDRFLSI